MGTRLARIRDAMSCSGRFRVGYTPWILFPLEARLGPREARGTQATGKQEFHLKDIYFLLTSNWNLI